MSSTTLEKPRPKTRPQQPQPRARRRSETPRRRPANDPGGHHKIPAQRSKQDSVPTTAPTCQTAKCPKPSRLGRFFTGFSLEKSFTMFSFFVALSVVVICSLDLAIAWPWMQASMLFDWTFLAVGITMLWMTYDVFKDQARV